MLTTYVLCMNNSNLGIMIAGNQRSPQCNYSKSPYSLSPPQKGLETRGRDGNFQRGAGLEKIPGVGLYGYFLELHITKHVFPSSLWYVVVGV